MSTSTIKGTFRHSHQERKSDVVHIFEMFPFNKELHFVVSFIHSRKMSWNYTFR
uniref:Uncharacterized protein n=1 Tax=Lepeophtheirus salmonis TaxID=72036 RepID=A0A0K2UD92_LEPSM